MSWCSDEHNGSADCFRYARKHARWLNVAEVEVKVSQYRRGVSGVCAAQRVPRAARAI